MTTGNSIVDAVGELDLTGNTVPNIWFQREEFRYASGAINLLSIVILADIIYWYRPREIRDEFTGKTLGYKKAFQADKLQRNYASLAEKFGCSKKQATDACHFLKNKGLIDLEFRTLHLPTKTGVDMVLNNVLFIAPNVKKIKELNTLSLSESIPSPLGSIHHTTLQVDTNTKNTYKDYVQSSGVKPSTTTGFNMKAEEVLKTVKNKKCKPSMENRWRQGIALITNGLYQKALTVKQKTQLKQLGVLLGNDRFTVLDWCLENWSKWAEGAGAAAGVSNPTQPDIGYLLKYHQYAVQRMQSIAQQTIVHEEVKKTEVKVVELKQEKYVPSAEELSQLMEELKC